jgi:5-bromo-4-chloroindolyl phosphate hydrolysis protein
MSVAQMVIIAVVIILGIVIFFLILKAMKLAAKKGGVAENKTTALPLDEQLRRLESLRKENLISELEYNEKRKKIMDV